SGFVHTRASQSKNRNSPLFEKAGQSPFWVMNTWRGRPPPIAGRLRAQLVKGYAQVAVTSKSDGRYLASKPGTKLASSQAVSFLSRGMRGKASNRSREIAGA